MPYFVAGLAFLEEFAPAGWAGVWFFMISCVRWDHDLIDRSPGPKQETSRTSPNWVFADWTQKTFVGFPILFDEPLGLGKGDCADEVDQNPCNDNQEATNEDVFEVFGGKVFVNNECNLDQGGYAKGEEKREVNAAALSDDEDSCHSKNRQQDRELKERQFEAVFLIELFELLKGWLPLPIDLLGNLILFQNKLLLLFDHFRYRPAQLLVFGLVLQEKS